MRGRTWAAWVILWALTMISLPIVKWTLGGTALQRGIVVGVIVQVAAVVFILFHHSGWTNALRLGLTVLSLAWLAEFIGSSTGLPFGRYQYTDVLQPQLGGVPLLIPLAWLMMLPPAWAVARLIVPTAGRMGFAAVSALAFTAWDLYLDPQMVFWDFWRWEQPGGYFGIPWSNYLGWLLVSGAISALWAGRSLPLIPLLTVYIITWLLQSIGQAFFWGLPGPALVGFLGMGGMLAWAYRQTKFRDPTS
jgi:putative membrane protein